MINHKKYITLYMTIFIIGLMTGLSEFFQNPEIIFPEMAAISVGALLAPEFAWNTNKLRILFFISLCAVLGVLIVRFLPVSPEIQLCIAFFLAQMIYISSGTSFAPMISALVLPVMLQTDSPVYLLSAFGFTVLILLCLTICEKLHLTEKKEFQPVGFPDKTAILQAIMRSLAGCLLLLPAVILNFRFAAAPPLLVAFTEFCKPDSPAQKNKIRILVLLFSCALTGSLCRYSFSILFSVPACIPAMLTILLVSLIMKKTGMFLPPAAAISILAYLIPANTVLFYPFQIAAGTAILLFLADLCRQKKTVPV